MDNETATQPAAKKRGPLWIILGVVLVALLLGVVFGYFALIRTSEVATTPIPAPTESPSPSPEETQEASPKGTATLTPKPGVTTTPKPTASSITNPTATPTPKPTTWLQPSGLQLTQ